MNKNMLRWILSICGVILLASAIYTDIVHTKTNYEWFFEYEWDDYQDDISILESEDNDSLALTPESLRKLDVEKELDTITLENTTISLDYLTSNKSKNLMIPVVTIQNQSDVEKEYFVEERLSRKGAVEPACVSFDGHLLISGQSKDNIMIFNQPKLERGQYTIEVTVSVEGQNIYNEMYEINIEG